MNAGGSLLGSKVVHGLSLTERGSGFLGWPGSSGGGFLVAPGDGRPVSFFSLKRRKLVRFQGNTHYLNLIG